MSKHRLLLFQSFLCSHKSSAGSILVVPKSKSKGDQDFSIRVPRLRNELPKEIRLTKTVSSFKSLFKTHFNRLVFQRSSFLLVSWAFLPSYFFKNWLLLILSSFKALLYIHSLPCRHIFCWLCPCLCILIFCHSKYFVQSILKINI